MGFTLSPNGGEGWGEGARFIVSDPVTRCFTALSSLKQGWSKASLPFGQISLISFGGQNILHRGEPMLFQVLALLRAERQLISVLELNLMVDRIGRPKNFPEFFRRRLKPAQFRPQRLRVEGKAEQEFLDFFPAQNLGYFTSRVLPQLGEFHGAIGFGSGEHRLLVSLVPILGALTNFLNRVVDRWS